MTYFRFLLGKAKNFLPLWLAFFLIVLGCRLIVCNHYAVDAPYADEWEMAVDLKQYEQPSAPLFSPWLLKPHCGHLLLFTRLEQALTAKFNGIWQLRVGSVFHALIYSAFALVTTFLVTRAAQKQSAAIFLGGLITFAIPWAGDRMLWPLLSAFSWMLFWAAIEVLVLVWVKRPALQLTLSLVVCALASLSLGSGPLTAVLAGSWFIAQLILGEPRRRFFLTAAVLHFGLFCFFYYATRGHQIGLASSPGATAKAFLSCLAFPTVNLWWLGIVAFAPWLALCLQTLRRPRKPTAEQSVLILLGAFVVLQALAIAVMRGENNNGGMPASRYYDILLIGPLLNLGILLRYFDGLPRVINARNLAVVAWITMTLGGYLLNFCWRVTPWLSLDSGEWEHGLRQAVLGAWSRGDVSDLTNYVDESEPELEAEVHRRIPIAVSLTNQGAALLPGALFGGYPLAATQDAGDFKLGGFPANRKPSPWLRYWGSYELGAPDRARNFESQPIDLTCDYLQFEFLLEKKARFRFYKLGACSLKMIRLSDGLEVDLLRSLKTSFPSILADRETVCIKVPGPGRYKIVAQDHELNSGWFAFSEPTPSGPLGAVAHGVLNCGKLFFLLGILLLPLAGFLRSVQGPALKPKDEVDLVPRPEKVKVKGAAPAY